MKRFKLIAKKVVAALMCSALIVLPSHAASLSDSTLVTGTIKLLNDLTTVLIALDGILSITLFIYNIIRMQSCEENEQVTYKKRNKLILIGAVVVVTISGLVKLILSYYA
jgi:hypothetical protein